MRHSGVRAGRRGAIGLFEAGRTLALSGAAMGVMALNASSLAGGPEVEVLATVGPTAAGEVFSPNLYFNSIDHFSASPGGSAVLVGLMLPRPGDTSGPTTSQCVWVRPAEGTWRIVARTNVTGVTGLEGSRITALLGQPIVNDHGEVLLVVSLALQSLTGATSVQPSVLRIAADGTSSLLLRFNTPANAGFPGVPAGLTSSSSVFYNAGMDAWRFSTSGAIYASSMSGLLADCGQGPMCFRTVANRSQVTGGTTTTIGTAVPVTTARTAVGLTAGGPSFQHVSMSGYTRDQLSGLLMFDQWGIANFAIRDGTTPIEGMPDQFVLSTFSNQDITPRVGVNSDCTTVFAGRYGIPPVTTGLNTTVPPPITGPLGLFVKDRWSSARLIAEAAPTIATERSLAPGVPGWRFAAFNNPVVNARGNVAFSATLAGPSANRASIWTLDESGQARAIAVVGVSSDSGALGAPPAAVGSQFTFIRTEPMLNRRGQIVFTAQISPTAGATTGLFDALCAYDPLGGLSILAKSNDMITVPGIGERPLILSTLSEIGGRPMIATGNDDGAATLLTDDGTVVFRAIANGVGPIVATVRIPTPSGACCAGSTCGVQAQLDCTGAAKQFAGVNTVCATNPAAPTCCIADFDRSGLVTVQDLFDFVHAWSGGDPMADLTGDGAIGFGDVIGYVQAYVSGCP